MLVTSTHCFLQALCLLAFAPVCQSSAAAKTRIYEERYATVNADGSQGTCATACLEKWIWTMGVCSFNAYGGDTTTYEMFSPASPTANEISQGFTFVGKASYNNFDSELPCADGSLNSDSTLKFENCATFNEVQVGTTGVYLHSKFTNNSATWCDETYICTAAACKRVSNAFKRFGQSVLTITLGVVLAALASSAVA